MGYSIIRDPATAGFVPSAPRARAGGSMGYFGPAAVPGVPSHGAALISELLSKQGRAAVPAPHRRSAELPPAPSVHPGARGAGATLGPSSVPPGAVALAQPHRPGTVALCSVVFSVVPCQGCTSTFRLKTSVCCRIGGKFRSPLTHSARNNN